MTSSDDRTPLEVFFADLDAEYARLGPQKLPTVRQRVRAALWDVRAWVADRIDPGRRR